jgi:hypothetical protein
VSTIEEQVARLEAAIAALEAQRTVLGDEIVETALAQEGGRPYVAEQRGASQSALRSSERSA